MSDVSVIADPAAAVVALDPARSALLAEVAAQPGSAAAIAARLGLARQKVTYHLNTLERHGLVTESGQRRHGGITERVMSAVAPSFAIAPAALGPAGADPARLDDRLSASYLVALAARAVGEVGTLLRGAERAGRPLATMSIDTDIRFRSAADRAEFAADLAGHVRALAARYHDESAPGGRWHRVVAVSHPRPNTEESS